jgi:hypothetical protein
LPGRAALESTAFRRLRRSIGDRDVVPDRFSFSETRRRYGRAGRSLQWKLPASELENRRGLVSDRS